MQSDHKQRNNRNVRVTRKRNNKVSRYLDSYPLPERDNVKPRVISSNPLSTTGSGSPSRQMDSFCPYGSLNYGSPTTSSSSLLYGDLKLRTPHERKLQQERRLSQGIAIGLVGLFVALILAGMFWMQYSNAHAATSSYVHQSES